VSKKVSNESEKSDLTYQSLKNINIKNNQNNNNNNQNNNNELKKVVSIQNLNDINESLLTIKLDQRMSSSKDEYNNVKMHSLNKNNSNGKSDPNM